MTTGIDVYLKARELVDTPYLHQGRLAGTAIDCIGVPIWVASELGLGNFDKSDYPRAPDGSMVELITSVCSDEIIQAGVLLVFKIDSVAQHCGIVSIYQNGLGLIHAWDIAGKVCEHRLTKDWINKVVGCYGLPGVTYGE
jgi:cell wall-associated NlpC family hydrolase